MLRAARCLTVRPGESIRLETEAGEIVLNVISAADGLLRVEVAPQNVESVSVHSAKPVRSKALTRGNAWIDHETAVK